MVCNPFLCNYNDTPARYFRTRNNNRPLMKYLNTLPEEEIKNRIRRDYFSAYEAAPILGKIDFAVAIPPLPLQEGSETPAERIYLLWAEAKKGTSHDIDESLVQLILTIGRARTFDQYMPPAFLGAFDAEKIAFVPYDDVRDIFYQNDFNWNVKPSDHRTREFRLVMETVRHTLEQGRSASASTQTTRSCASLSAKTSSSTRPASRSCPSTRPTSRPSMPAGATPSAPPSP